MFAKLLKNSCFSSVQLAFPKEDGNVTSVVTEPVTKAEWLEDLSYLGNFINSF